jgi:uncharacterized YccA/Bax inhibitor family protein
MGKVKDLVIKTFKGKGNLILKTGLIILFALFMVFLLPFAFLFGLDLIGLNVHYGGKEWLGSFILLSLISFSRGNNGSS